MWLFYEILLISFQTKINSWVKVQIGNNCRNSLINIGFLQTFAKRLLPAILDQYFYQHFNHPQSSQPLKSLQ